MMDPKECNERVSQIQKRDRGETPRKTEPRDPIGWNKIKTAHRTITYTTLPTGPVERTITYQAPFTRCNSEKDYKLEDRSSKE